MSGKALFMCSSLPLNNRGKNKQVLQPDYLVLQEVKCSENASRHQRETLYNLVTESSFFPVMWALGFPHFEARTSHVEQECIKSLRILF